MSHLVLLSELLHNQLRDREQGFHQGCCFISEIRLESPTIRAAKLNSHSSGLRADYFMASQPWFPVFMAVKAAALCVLCCKKWAREGGGAELSCPLHHSLLISACAMDELRSRISHWGTVFQTHTASLSGHCGAHMAASVHKEEAQMLQSRWWGVLLWSVTNKNYNSWYEPWDLKILVL